MQIEEIYCEGEKGLTSVFGKQLTHRLNTAGDYGQEDPRLLCL